MDKYKKYSLGIIIYLYILFIILLLVNYIINPFDIFKNNILKYTGTSNERFVKMEHIIKNHDKYNSYMFGSSRIGVTDPAIVEKYIDNSKFYNFTISQASMYDYDTMLQYFIKNKYMVKNLYIQIDVADFMDMYKHPDSDYLYKPDAVLTGEDKYKFYLNYLTIFPVSNYKIKLLNNYNKDEFKYDFYTTGMYYKKEEALMNKDLKGYLEKEPTFHAKPGMRNVNYDIVDQNLKSLKNVKDLCKKNNINLIILNTPYNQNLMNDLYINDYCRIEKQISAITDFWDFSGYNSITTDNSNYYEWSHYRPKIAKIIAAKIFDDKAVAIPKDFGEYVNKNNIENHINTLKIQKLKQ